MIDMHNFYVFTGAFALSQILLALAKILSQKNLDISELLFTSFLICIGIYLTQPLLINESFIGEQYHNSRWIELIWQHLPTAIPALFLFCCAAIFQDRFKLKVIYTLPLLVTLVPPLLFDLFSLTENYLRFLMVTLPQGLEFILLGLGLWIVMASWRNDLIENRRRFRLLVMGCAGSIILVVIVAQQLTNISEEQIDLLHYPFACLFLICFNLFLLELNKETILLSNTHNTTLQNTQPSAVTTTTNTSEQNTHSAELYAVLTLMLEQKPYRNAELTITLLAYKLKLPEYKLRKLINQELGYRNFNEFLNHYRVQEACYLLTETDESVTNIAVNIGYNAISAFNRSFKEIQQQTPSEFRKNLKKA